MPYEDPREMLRRLRLGREELCQRLVTTLIIGGVYPKWGTISTPTASGSGFLHDLDRMSFGESVWSEATKFVDEFELPRRVESEPGAIPTGQCSLTTASG